jgi:hypothetical protein
VISILKTQESLYYHYFNISFSSSISVFWFDKFIIGSSIGFTGIILGKLAFLAPL